jgi:hypothetical protein
MSNEAANTRQVLLTRWICIVVDRPVQVAVHIYICTNNEVWALLYHSAVVRFFRLRRRRTSMYCLYSRIIVSKTGVIAVATSYRVSFACVLVQYMYLTVSATQARVRSVFYSTT